MADLFEGLNDVGVEMCQCPCDSAGAVQATAQAQARLLGGGGGGDGNVSMSAYILCAAAFFVMLVFCMWRVMEPLPKIQTMCLRTRLYWCIKCNVFVCTLSCFLSILHCTNFEDLLYGSFGFPNNNLIKPLEYIVTCPAMMLILVVMAGEAVPARRQLEVMACTTCILLLGFSAQMSTTLPAKLMFYICGCTFFIVLMSRVEMCVRQHSNGKESMFSGGLSGSAYKKMCLKTACTWVLFPIWFLLSPEGLAVVSDYSTAVLITAALNIYSKSFYVVYVVIIYDIYVGEESLLHKPHGQKMSHEDHGAAEAAARLGPNEAIACLEKSMKKNQESINQIRKLMIRDEQRKEASLKREQMMQQQESSLSGGAVSPPSTQSTVPNTSMMYPQGTVPQGMMSQVMADPAMLSARQSGMSAMQPDVGSMNTFARSPSNLPSSRQQPMMGMGGTMVPTLPLTGSSGFMNPPGSFNSTAMAPDYTAPQGMNAQLQQTEVHAAAVPITLGATERSSYEFQKGPDQPQGVGASQQMQTAQAQIPPMPYLQMHPMYTNQMAQPQRQQEQVTSPMAKSGQLSLSSRSVTSSMPDPDVKHRIDVGAPKGPPSNVMTAGLGTQPRAAPDTGGLVSGGIGVSAPTKETDGSGNSNWRQVGGFTAPALLQPMAVPAPPSEDQTGRQQQ